MTEPTGLPPEQEAVRRLLAGARHDGATPPEVVARLDETLASLVAERGDSPVPVAPVVDLGARRRRLAGVGLLAAAAVVVAGVAIGQGLPRMQGSSDAGSSAGGDSATSQRDFAAEDSEAGGGADSGNLAESPREPQPEESYLTPGLVGVPKLLTFDDDLDDELLDLRASRAKTSSADEALRTTGCLVSGIGPGRRVQVLVDGALGFVVFRRADGAAQQVDLYVCGDPQPVRTLTLPAP